MDDDWDFLEPKEIADPDATQPEEWDDNPFLDDPEDVKPEVFTRYLYCLHLESFIILGIL